MPFTSSGFVPYTAQEAIDVINAIFIDVFGANVNLSPSSVNGQFIQQLANKLINNETFMTTLTTSTYNPNVNSGVWLDMICNLLGIYRQVATYSNAICTCFGSAGTVIPQGIQIVSTNGDIFQSQAVATIGVGGSIEMEFVAIVSGAVPVLANTLNNIITRIYGWDSVTNVVEGTIGGTTETDNELRNSRVARLYTQGSASLGSIYSSLLSVPNVLDVYVQENDTVLPITIDGVTIPPNNIYLAVLGGTGLDIATAIYNKKSPGITMYGNTNYTITTIYNTQWTAIYQTPVQIPLQVNITVGNSAFLPVGIETQIKDVIVNNFNGTDINVPSATAITIAELINCYRFAPSLLAIGVTDTLSLTIQTIAGIPAVFIQLDALSIATLIQSNVIVTLV